MPFTPIHMGPGILIKALLQRSFSLMVFGWAQTVMDLQPLFVLIRGHERIDRAQDGNLGDHHAVGGQVSEMRIDHGPGYRIYYTIRGDELLLLLVGGDKSSQPRDIEKAKRMATEIGE